MVQVAIPYICIEHVDFQSSQIHCFMPQVALAIQYTSVIEYIHMPGTGTQKAYGLVQGLLNFIE